MGVLNELIGAVSIWQPANTSRQYGAYRLFRYLQVKFIKFFAWENRWIQRVLDAREVEMQWMIKGTSKHQPSAARSQLCDTCSAHQFDLLVRTLDLRPDPRLRIRVLRVRRFR